MHPRLKISTDRLVRFTDTSSGDASTMDSSLSEDDSGDHRSAITSGACQPTLPAPAPAMEGLAAGPAPTEPVPSVLMPKLL
ncbi:hypothetical protein ACHAXS_005622 [Conticribra weissflogii]